MDFANICIEKKKKKKKESFKYWFEKFVLIHEKDWEKEVKWSEGRI